MPLRFKKIAVFYNEHKEESVLWAKRIKEEILKKGARVAGVSCRDHGKWREKADLVLALGGDGTVLHAARDLAGKDIALLGVNSGSLGFLSGLDAKDFPGRVDDILGGRFTVQKRSLLEVGVYNRGKLRIRPQLAFNDCVLRVAQSRAMHVKAKYEGRFLKTYFGDGLIIATPSGSTAYSLAASGPIVHPALNVLLLTPICPHMLTQRPLVLPADSPITIEPAEGHGGFRVTPVLSLDGQINFELKTGDTVLVARHKHDIKLLMPKEYDYFGVLSKKLKWGER